MPNVFTNFHNINFLGEGVGVGGRGLVGRGLVGAPKAAISLGGGGGDSGL